MLLENVVCEVLVRVFLILIEFWIFNLCVTFMSKLDPCVDLLPAPIALLL